MYRAWVRESRVWGLGLEVLGLGCEFAGPVAVLHDQVCYSIIYIYIYIYIILLSTLTTRVGTCWLVIELVGWLIRE